jgi:phosphomannomutase/phosphoglucomutase
VVATGNGTAGAFAPAVLEAVGCEVVPLHTALDHSFPHYNPNPEELEMLDDVARLVRESGADIGLAFDGDGDRCGVVDDRGRAIFADKIGLLLARDIADQHRQARFVVDVKSTSLFTADPVLKARGATTEYWKTGHSYIKHRLHQTGAIAGFEKSGHFFFNAPIGHGYDDAMVTALAICDMLGRNPGRSMAELYDALPQSWGSPTMSAHCPDEVKYRVAERVTRRIEAMARAGEKLAGHAIAGLVTVNGIRVTTTDGSWGLVRASSNKPELVVVVESPASEARMREMFRAMDGLLRENPEVGAYNQTI